MVQGGGTRRRHDNGTHGRSGGCFRGRMGVNSGCTCGSDRDRGHQSIPKLCWGLFVWSQTSDACSLRRRCPEIEAKCKAPTMVP